MTLLLMQQVSYSNRSMEVLSSVGLDAWFAGGTEPTPNSALVNGVGRFPGGPAVPWARINVEYGKRYRFRLIGLSAAGTHSDLYPPSSNQDLLNHNLQPLSNFRLINTA
jgi:Multicopper oxidase